MTERTDLVAEATSLGLINFQKNISSVKLRALVAEAKGEPPPVEETAPPSPAMKPEADVETETEVPVQTQALDAYARKRAKVQAAKKRAFTTHVVTVTNKDNRENDVMTTAYASFENEHFALSKYVPLDVPVELEQSLIGILAATTMTLHKAEIRNGRDTGNKVPVTVKKFAISYSHRDKK